jgi:hypothetical protein
MQNFPSSIGGTAWRNLFPRWRKTRGWEISQIRWRGGTNEQGDVQAVAVEREGVGGGRTAKVSSSPWRPPFIWTNHRTGLSGPSLDRIFRSPDNLAQKWPRLSSLELLCSGKLERERTCVHGENVWGWDRLRIEDKHIVVLGTWSCKTQEIIERPTQVPSHIKN